MGLGGDAGTGPDPVKNASNSSSSGLHVVSRGAGERIRARARGAEGLSRTLDVLEVDVEGFVEHSVEDVEDAEKYGEVLSAE
jgi:hypothetical protein